jgi:hypothetical protein
MEGYVQYTFDVKVKPTIYGGFAYGSGASQDGKVNEFNNQEIDALVKWRFVPWASLSGGYAVFIPNQGSQNLGHDIATHWAYAMITLRTP